MASPNSTFTQLVTSTLEKRSKEVSDNVLDHVPLLRYLKRNVKLVDGGRTIVEPLAYAENTNAGFYTGSQALATANQSFLTAAEYNWKQYYVMITGDGLEMHQNSGDSAIINLAQAKIENAMSTAQNDIAASIFSDGTGSSGLEIGGLQLLVADSPTTGTVGGINRATSSNAFWRNQVFDASTDGAATSATTIQSNLNKAWLETVRNSAYPDLIVMDSVYYSYFQSSLQAIQRVTDEESASAGFANLAFYGPGGRATVMYDSNCPASHAYLLNTSHLFFKVHSKRNFVVDTERMAINQDASVIPVFFMGNLTMNNAERQSVYKE